MAENTFFDNLQFEIELEMVVRPNEKGLSELSLYVFNTTPEALRSTIQGGSRDENRNKICFLLRDLFDQGHLPVNEDAEDYTKWTIGDDPSILEHDLEFGVEIASPIFRASDVANWFGELQKIFAIVRDCFDIITDEDRGCATLVHISPVSGFSLEQIRSLSRGVFLLQDAIAMLSPPGDEYSRLVSLPDTHFDDANQLSRQQLIDAMNPDTIPIDLRIDEAWDRKYVAWNFLSLDRLGTIKYRQGRFCRSPGDAVKWISLALSAVEVFLQYDLDALRHGWDRHELAANPAVALALLLLGSQHFTSLDRDVDIPSNFFD